MSSPGGLLTVLLVIVPLLGAVLTLRRPGSRPDRHRARTGVAAGVLVTALAVALAVSIWRAGAVTTVQVMGPGALQVHLVADGLAVAAVVMTSVTAVAVAGFAAAEDAARPADRHRGYWPLGFALWASLHLLFLAGDLFTAYLMFEAIGVVGAGLVMLGGGRETLLAGTRYLYAELVASTTVLVGIGLIWRETGTLVFSDLGPALTDSAAGGVAVAIVTAGLLLKVPLAPIHLWLPAAHALAPSAVSPLLSAVVVKSAFVVLVRLWFLAAPELVTRAAAQLLGGLGVVAIVWGSVAALRAEGIKELIAYSTVAQLGFLFLLPPLVAAGSGAGWTGGLLYAVAHALAKAALLMAAAVLVADAGHGRVAELHATATQRPLAVFAIGVAAVSLVGLPPTGGFVAKWYLLVASLETGQWWWIPPIALGSLLTAGYLMRIIRPAFAAGPRAEGVVTRRDARDGLALTLALGTVALGLRPTELLQLLEVGAPTALSGGG